MLQRRKKILIFSFPIWERYIKHTHRKKNKNMELPVILPMPKQIGLRLR